MKEIYTKPTLNIEYFALSQTIATSCGWSSDKYTGHPTHAVKEVCGWNDGFGEVYWTAKPACDGEYSPDLDIGEVCYNAPNGGAQIFAS
ncbi:MAG: hypothetical protein SPE35_09130 [Butyricicoccus sp.]|nr:hypothetical protein [Butyricicoccus sp.]